MLPDELEKFIKYLSKSSVTQIVVDSIHKLITLNSLDSNSEEFKFVQVVNFKTIEIIKPYLEKYWLIDELSLKRKLLVEYQEVFVQSLTLIKSIYSEKILFELVDLIKRACLNEKLISFHVVNVIKSFASRIWLLDMDLINKLKSIQIKEWNRVIQAHTNELKNRKRDLNELFNIMQRGADGVNNSINLAFAEESEYPKNMIKSGISPFYLFLSYLISVVVGLILSQVAKSTFFQIKYLQCG